MGKILFFALLALIIYIVIKSRWRPGAPRRSGDSPVEEMVACARCGINVPRSEAIEWQGRRFCCDEHRALGPG